MAAQNETMTEIAKALSRGPAKITLSTEFRELG